MGYIPRVDVVFNSPRSPFHPLHRKAFKHDNKLFMSQHQAYVYYQAKFVKDTKAMEMLVGNKTYEEVEGIRKLLKPIDKEEWAKVEDRVVECIIRDKFREPYLRSVLALTGDKEIVYANPIDKVWGNGMLELDMWTSSIKSDGQNKLGKMLMKIRDNEINVKHRK